MCAGIVFAADVHHRPGAASLLPPSADMQRAPSARLPLSSTMSATRAASGRLPLSAAAGASRAATASGRLPTALGAAALKAARHSPTFADADRAGGGGRLQRGEADAARDVSGTAPIAVPAPNSQSASGVAHSAGGVSGTVPLPTARFSRATPPNGVSFTGSPRGSASSRGRLYSSKAARSHSPLSGGVALSNSGSEGRGGNGADVSAASQVLCPM